MGLVRAAEWWLAVGILVLSTDAIVSLVRNENGVLGSAVVGDPFVQTIWAVAYVLVLLAAVSHPARLRALLVRGRFFWALVGLALLSGLWSVDAAVTLRRGFALVGTTLVGSYLGVRYSQKDLLRLTLWAFAFCIIVSMFFVIALPNYGIESGIHYGSWRGAYIQKNILGRLMAVACVLFLGATVRARQLSGKALFASLSALAILLTVKSGSAGGVVVMVTLSAALTLLPFARQRSYALLASAAALLVGLGSAGVWLFSNAPDVLAALGRDATLTGRTSLWQAVVTMIRLRPLLGYGYGAFWLGNEGPSAEVWRMAGWNAAHAHNGFLDVALGLGAAGLAFVLLLLAITLAGALRAWRRSGSPESLLPVVWVGYLVVTNMDEVSLLAQNSIGWLLLVALSVSLSSSVTSLREEATPKKNGVNECVS